MNLTKAKIIDDIYSKSQFSKRESARLLESMLEIIKEELCSRDKIKIEGLGLFLVKKKAARMGRNPRSGDEIKIEPRKVITFKPSKVLKENINERYAHRLDKDGQENTSIPPRKGDSQALEHFDSNTTGGIVK